MFQINQSENTTTKSTLNVSTPKSFDSIEKFSNWLDRSLDQLISQYSEFETDESVREFFKRS